MIEKAMYPEKMPETIKKAVDYVAETVNAKIDETLSYVGFEVDRVVLTLENSPKKDVLVWVFRAEVKIRG